jgi:hypothetical protein
LEAETLREAIRERLAGLRLGPHGIARAEAKRDQLAEFQAVYGARG